MIAPDEAVDRAAIHFNISGLSGPVGSASLVRRLANNVEGELGLPLGHDIYSYAADGSVSASVAGDFSASSLANSFSVGTEAIGTAFSLEVTVQVNALHIAGKQFDGFSVRRGFDRYRQNSLIRLAAALPATRLRAQNAPERIRGIRSC